MLILPHTITTQEARATLRMLTQALDQDAKASAEALVTVDASNLQQFDSAALAVLLECQRVAQAWGKALAVRRAPPKLVELARLYGMDSVLTLADAAA